jgi:hypothetical protein
LENHILKQNGDTQFIVKIALQVLMVNLTGIKVVATVVPIMKNHRLTKKHNGEQNKMSCKPEIPEQDCPCSEASEDNCEDCQDLPRGTFAYWRKQKASKSQEQKAKI